jgi:hypothetical protein
VHQRFFLGFCQRLSGSQKNAGIFTVKTGALQDRRFAARFFTVSSFPPQRIGSFAKEPIACGRDKTLWNFL